MKTNVVPITSLPLGWQTHPDYSDHVYIGRRMYGLLPPYTFGNPFRVGTNGEDGQPLTAEDCLRLYEALLPVMLASIPFRQQVRTLSGKTLVCWCKPGAPCHGHVLARMADELADEAKAMRPLCLHRAA